MALLVQKFGGTSVGDADRIRAVAEHVARTKRDGNDIVVVVSAMGKTTDDLIRLAGEVSSTPSPREYDMLVSAGERVSAPLLCMALADFGVPAVSFTGSQAGIITTTEHSRAKIIEVKGDRLREALAEGKVPVVAGFQGVSTDRDVTTLGRGGSDTTAVALAAALGASVCEIYTDVTVENFRITGEQDCTTPDGCGHRECVGISDRMPSLDRRRLEYTGLSWQVQDETATKLANNEVRLCRSRLALDDV